MEERTIGKVDYPTRRKLGLRPRCVVCSYCKYSWTTLSDAWFVTCPNCSHKTKRPVDPEEEKDESTNTN